MTISVLDLERGACLFEQVGRDFLDEFLGELSDFDHHGDGLLFMKAKLFMVINAIHVDLLVSFFV